MRLELSGAPVIHADQQLVWNCLVDPAFVSESAPGTKRVELLGADRFRLHLELGIAFLRIGFSMDVHMHDLIEPDSAALTAEGTAHGANARVESTVRIVPLTPSQQQLAWHAVGTVDGALATIGAPLVEAALRALSRDFWNDFARRVSAWAGQPNGSRSSSDRP